METLLEINNLKKYYPIVSGGILRRTFKMCKAVDNISFTINKGACFGIAGESGSGKTTLVKMLLLMEKVTGGSVLFEGKDIQTLSRAEIMWYRSRVQTIFQDSASSLDPRMRIKEIIGEPLEVQRTNRLSHSQIQAKIEEIIQQVGLGVSSLRKYPHELSGGQKQRVAIARAIILEPDLVILDEPVSALDVSIRAQILNLLADIQERRGLTYLIIAHDLGMLQHITTDIGVIYLGQMVELGKSEEVFSHPLHPYTRALFEAVPRPKPGRVKTSSALMGEIGNPIDPPPGCRFHPRCNLAKDRCRFDNPPLREISPGHQVACFLNDSQTG